jgi:hypothetical protein
MHHELVEELMGGSGFVRMDPSHKILEAVFEHSKSQAGVMGVADECCISCTHLSVDVGTHIRGTSPSNPGAPVVQGLGGIKGPSLHLQWLLLV